MPQGSLDSSHILGAVVMLYHPCAPKDLVNQLRKIVVKCLRKQYFLHKFTLFLEQLFENRSFDSFYSESI